MASFSNILKELLNVKNSRVEKVLTGTEIFKQYGVEQVRKILNIEVSPYKRKQCLCPICMKKCPIYDHKRPEMSRWRAPDFNGVPVYLCYRPARIMCKEHGVHTEYIPWADGKSRFTADFNNEVAWLVSRMSKSDIALYLGINWRTVGNCVDAACKRIEPDTSVRWNGLKRICVDETSYKGGHNYITVVYDMDRNQVIWIAKDHGQEIFGKFCEALTEEQRESIEIVAGDGAKWIDACVSKYFPNATRCIDFFHVVQWVNDALDKIRRATHNKACKEYRDRQKELEELEKEIAAQRKKYTDELKSLPKRGRPSKRKLELLELLAALEPIYETEEKGVGRPASIKLSKEHADEVNALRETAVEIKNSRYALGKNPQNLTENQAQKLELIKNSYPDLYKGYQHKEALRLILHMKDPDFALQELENWIADVEKDGDENMIALAEKIGRHKDNIINSIKHHANSAKSESTNTSIKVLIRMGRGFRSMENLFSLIYLKCSDLIIPLNNRPQPSAEVLKEMRENANQRRKARLSMQLANAPGILPTQTA